jgi:hypothetical protein
MTAVPSDIKWPRHSPHSKVEKALKTVPRDGDVHLVTIMGPSSAEQTARAYNVDGGNWLLGYTSGVEGQEIVSYLWAKWVG